VQENRMGLLLISHDLAVVTDMADRVVIMRHGEVMDRLAKGEKVDADLIYCRTVASFEAPRGSKYEWMNHTLFVGSVERLPDAAIVRFYRVE